MASQPPESILLSQFNGVRNTVTRERLTVQDLESAINVDIDDAGQLHRRRGYRRVDPVSYHSVRTIAGQTLGVRDGTLGRINPDYSFVPLDVVGSEPLDYTAVGDTIYFSSLTASGKLTGDVVEAWGAIVAEGQWVSPVVRPTETLGAVRGKLLGRPPMATSIELYKGRIFLAAENVLWATELYLYNLVDKTRNFIPFEHDITLLAAVDDGLYVGTTAQLLFLQGTFKEGMRQQIVMDAPVIPGSLASVPRSKAHPGARSSPMTEANCPIFLTGRGVCLGLNGGEVYNLTQDHVALPNAVRAAALYREDQGANTYVAVMDSAGGPAANAQIGDYVDAEIRRASQGG